MKNAKRWVSAASFHVWFASAALGVAIGCGSENALVGGKCKDGLLAQDGACVTPGNSPFVGQSGTEPPEGTPTPETANGEVHPPTFSRDAGETITFPDHDADVVDPDGGLVSPDGAAPDAAPPDAAAPDAQPDVGVPDADTPDAPDADVEPTCTPPLVYCRGACIPVGDDSLNCGACGKVCPSNICMAGECQGETPGDVVLVGHDFAQAWAGSAQAKVLVNAVAIATTNPIRVLTWESGASAASVTAVKTLVQAGVRGRRVRFTPAPGATALADATLATQYDVVLVFDAAGSDPGALGASWATGLGKFAEKGGIVIALDGAASGMPSLVTAAGLLSVPAHTLLGEGSHLAVTAPNDVVGQQVLSPYATTGAAVCFPGASPPAADVTWVVRTDDDAGTGAPVVIHRTVR